MCPNDFLKEKKTFSSSKLTDFFSSLLRLAFTSSSSATGITRARFCVSACRCYHFLLPSCREMSEIMISAVTSRNIGHCHPSYEVKKKRTSFPIFSQNSIEFQSSVCADDAQLLRFCANSSSSKVCGCFGRLGRCVVPFFFSHADEIGQKKERE